MGLTLKFKLKKLKEKGKQNLFVIPYFFTFANAVFGLFSVIKTLEGDFLSAAYCIMLAGVMDLFDGRLARAFGSTSVLGMELDSLCDAVSFCFAPAILLYSWYLHNIGIFGFIAVSLYLCCGLLRLAKFNILSSEDSSFPRSSPGPFGLRSGRDAEGQAGSAQEFFIGLTTTLSAFLIAQLVLNFDWISHKLLPFLQNPYGLGLFIITIALLMISPVPFLSFKKVNPKLSLVGGFLVIIIFAIGFAYGMPLLFIGILSYILSSIFYFIYSKCMPE